MLNLFYETFYDPNWIILCISVVVIISLYYCIFDHKIKVHEIEVRPVRSFNEYYTESRNDNANWTSQDRFKYEYPTKLAETEEEFVFYTKQLVNRCKRFPVLGLDCEWVSYGKNRGAVALLQLASPDGYTTLFRLNLKKNCPPCLKDLLGDESVLKVGVGVVIDKDYLRSDYGVVGSGFLDLRYVAGCDDGLAKLSQSYLGISLDKDWRIRASNWEAEELTDEQIHYAAQDARAAVFVFKQIFKYKLKKGNRYWLSFVDRSYTTRLHDYKLNEAKPLDGEIENVCKSTRKIKYSPLCTYKNLGEWVLDDPKGFCSYFFPKEKQTS